MPMLHDAPLHEYPAWHEAGDEAWAAYGAVVYAAAVARRERDATPAGATMAAMTTSQRSMSNRRSFSNGNAGPDEDPWSGNPLRSIHWWMWA